MINVVKMKNDTVSFAKKKPLNINEIICNGSKIQSILQAMRNLIDAMMQYYLFSV